MVHWMLPFFQTSIHLLHYIILLRNGFREQEGQTFGEPFHTSRLEAGRCRYMRILSLEEWMPKTHLFHHPCLLANSGTFSITALGWDMMQRLSTKKFMGQSWFYEEYLTSHKLSLKLCYCSDLVWVSGTPETLQWNNLTQCCNLSKLC